MYPHAIATPPTPTPNFFTPTKLFFKGISGGNRPSNMSLVAQEIKDKAEVCYGDSTCREKFMLLLSEIGFPGGLIVIEEIEECGYVKETGFVWLKHKKKKDHYYKFDNILINYDALVTAYFEQNRIKNLTGVKAKEFLIWITLSEIYVNDNQNCHHRTGLITFKTPSGLSKSFPLALFQSDEEPTGPEEDQVKQGDDQESRKHGRQ